MELVAGAVEGLGGATTLRVGGGYAFRLDAHSRRYIDIRMRILCSRWAHRRRLESWWVGIRSSTSARDSPIESAGVVGVGVGVVGAATTAAAAAATGGGCRDELRGAPGLDWSLRWSSHSDIPLVGGPDASRWEGVKTEVRGDTHRSKSRRHTVDECDGHGEEGTGGARGSGGIGGRVLRRDRRGSPVRGRMVRVSIYVSMYVCTYICMYVYIVDYLSLVYYIMDARMAFLKHF